MTHGARILVVDDEPHILRSLRTTLAAHGYDVQMVASGEEALVSVEDRMPDLIVLDLVLPGLSGLAVCQAIRDYSTVPILVLSARGDERDKVKALDVGADDYLTKPFGIQELLARIRAALRRSAGARGSTPVIQAGDLRIDIDRRRVTCSDAEIRVTPTEYDLLKTLAVNSGRVLTHGYLLRTVWGPAYDGESQILRVFIGQLRRKIEQDSARPQYIVTEPGVGYRFYSDD